MLVPEGYSYDEVVLIICGVIEKQYKKYKFNIYDYDDMYQESYLICHAALERYNPSKGKLENFLSFNLCNRLKILLRDKTRSPLKMLDIDTISTEDREKLTIEDEQQCELLEWLDHNLPGKYRQDFLRVMSGQKISKPRKDKLKYKIATLLDINVSDADQDNKLSSAVFDKVF